MVREDPFSSVDDISDEKKFRSFEMLSEKELLTLDRIIKKFAHSVTGEEPDPAVYTDPFTFLLEERSSLPSAWWPRAAQNYRITLAWIHHALLYVSSLESTDQNQPAIHNYGTIHMGDIFSNISNSNVTSKSKVENAFNALQSSGSEDAANLIVAIGDLVAKSNDVAAGAVYAKLTDEVAKPVPDKGIIKSCWDGLVAILPSVASLGDTASKVLLP